MASAAPYEIHQRDDGLWSIGFGDDARGPFASREFAAQIASGYPPAPAAKFCRFRIREARYASA
jgi:hypothetical protein